MKENMSSWFKVLAVCTAVGLGGTYVWRQQQKETPKEDKTVDPTVLSDSESAAPTPLPAAQEENDPFWPGPKSTGIFTPEQDRTLMPSSKTGIIELKTEDKKKRAIMPGSKSLSPILRAPETKEP
jgi:hypothetical protein